jgi:hypothetical protein
MRTSFFPSKDGGLLRWSENFSQKLSADAGAYGISNEQAAQYAGLHLAFKAAMAASAPTIRSKTTTAQKNSAREALKAQARLLVSIIRGQNVTDAQKTALGLTVRRAPQRIPAPSDPPFIAVQSVTGLIVRLELRRFDASGRSKPPGVHSALIYTFLGNDPPVDAADWTLTATTTRTRIALPFPGEVAPGTKVWFSGCWLNPRAQRGPMSAPVPTHIQGGAPAVHNNAIARAA